MRVLVIGASGQLGWELARTRPEGVALELAGSSRCDIRDSAVVRALVAETRPEVIINTAAYTAVDRAEQERDAAFALNGHGPRHLAEAAAATGCRLIQVSTDFVFDGTKSSPYLPDAPCAPLGVYGESKLTGERAVMELLGERACVVRTAWLYSSHGNNFVKTMLRLMDERESLGVVADQIGTPTWGRGLAEALWLAAKQGIGGVHHWTDSGVASWYDFSVAIQEEGLAIGLLAKEIAIRPIRTEDYPTPARRPSYSVLDKCITWAALGIEQPIHWRVALRRMLAEYKAELSSLPAQTKLMPFGYKEESRA